MCGEIIQLNIGHPVKQTRDEIAEARPQLLAKHPKLAKPEDINQWSEEYVRYLRGEYPAPRDGSWFETDDEGDEDASVRGNGWSSKAES